MNPTLSMKSPFTTSRRYALCPSCEAAFDPVSQYRYMHNALPDDCDGTVERVYCSDCKWQYAPQFKHSPLLAVVACALFTIGIIGLICIALANR